MIQYYTYVYYDNEWFPYYVGKGSGSRFRDDHGSIVIPSRDHILIQYRDSESLAFEAEKILITLFGRQDIKTGVLLNQDEGGRGPSKRTCIKGGRKGGRKTASIEGHMSRLGRIGGLTGGKITGPIQGHNNVTSGHIIALGHSQGRKNVESGQQKVSARLGGLASGPESIVRIRKTALHTRWHVKRNIINPACPLCAGGGNNEQAI